MSKQILTGRHDPIHPPSEKDSHACPACNKATHRRIRRYPTLGYEDARCDKCVRTNKWPEQEEGAKYGATPAQGPASQADPNQTSLIEGGGTE